ncbi:MAG TPA: helix-turn-helix domain-containing protein [Gemmatimonadales bacterium]|nr:helix-turn-helix domain-containing protein [Gemmatimonadales bacterium]
MGATLPIADPNLPRGHKGQRGAVLVHVKRGRRVTAKSLASTLGVSLNAVRHHLKELEAQGLITYEREHRGVGAPVYLYSLSPAGEALFPRRYEETLTALLDRIVEREGREAAVALLESHVAELARHLGAALEGVPAERRLEVVARVRTEQGYMAQAAASGAGGVLSEHNCALHAVAERFPEICAAEQRLLGEVLGAEVHRREHILSGCPSCEYHVRFKES